MALYHVIRFLRRFLITGIVAYFLVAGGLYAFQRALIYFPETSTPVPADWRAADMHVISLTTEDNFTLHAWYKPATIPSFPTLILFHGNTGHMGNRVFKVRPYMDAGYGVLLVEYRGYSGNPGTPTEDGIYADGRAALAYIKNQNISPEKIVLYGESLGTGVAVRLAWEMAQTGTPVAGLVLEAPYTSVADAGAYRYPFLPTRWLTWDRFDNLSRIGDVRTPILIIHGTADTIVPFALGQQLFNAAVEPKKAWFIDGAGHNNLYDYGMAKNVLAFLAEVK